MESIPPEIQFRRVSPDTGDRPRLLSFGNWIASVAGKDL